MLRRVKPFLLLSTREDDEAADDELAAFRRFMDVGEGGLQRHRLERHPLPDVDLDDWSGILLGGSPYTTSERAEHKSAVQRRVEADLYRLLDTVVARDFPFLGACYGIGTLGSHQGARVDATYAEPVAAVRVELTDAGRADPVLGALPASFDAFVGHKEALVELPAHGVRLAGSPACPIQAFRVGRHVYATQFHPELDAAGLCLRVEVYRHSGYFEPDDVRTLQAMARESAVQHPPLLLRRFSEVYARS